MNNLICPCIFTKPENDFLIVAIYIDDLNHIGTPEKLTKAVTYLKREFEMKDLGEFFFLSINIEHFREEIFLHKKMQPENILKCFYMEKAHQLTSSMVV